MKQRKSIVLVLGLLLITSIIGESSSFQNIPKSAVGGDSSSYVVVPFNVNVVKGTTIDEATVRERIAKMNEIYNCEVVIFVWDGTINEIDDPNGGDDGIISDDLNNRTAVRNQASQNAGKGGVSITIANDLGDPNTNGIAKLGDAHSSLVRGDADGTTWAHEVQHALGQSHGNARPADVDINGDAPGNGEGWDINGDGLVDNEDKKYNLWGSSGRTDNKMTPAGHQAIFGNASAIPGARVRNRPQTTPEGLPPIQTTQSFILTDPRGDTLVSPGLNTSDIIQAGFNVDPFPEPEGNITFWTTLGGSSNPGSIIIKMFFRDPASPDGDPAEHFANWMIEFGCDEWNTITYATKNQWNGVDWDEIFSDPGLPANNLVQIFKNETVDKPEGDGFQVDSFFDVTYEIDIPKSDIPEFPFLVTPTGEPVPVHVKVIANSTEEPYYGPGYPPSEIIIDDMDETDPVPYEWFPPEIGCVYIDTESIINKGLLTISGTFFVPETAVNFELDGFPIGDDTTNTTGSFVTSVEIDAKNPRENMILTVDDLQGNVDALYVNVEPVEDPGDGGDGGFEIPGYSPIYFVTIGVCMVFFLSYSIKRKR